MSFYRSSFHKMSWRHHSCYGQNKIICTDSFKLVSILHNLFSLLMKGKQNKLHCLSLAILYSLVDCLWVRTGAYHRGQNSKSVCFDLTFNNRQGWEGLPETNPLAYLAPSPVTIFIPLVSLLQTFLFSHLRRSKIS